MGSNAAPTPAVIAAFVAFALAAALPFAPLAAQKVEMEARVRSYKVGAVHVTERVAPLTLTLQGTRARLRFTSTPLTFDAPADRLRGTTPLGTRLDLRFRSDDSLRVFYDGTSTPSALDSLQNVALGSVGTSTLDLDSYALGTPAVFGARGSLGVWRGTSAQFRVRAGVDVSPAPSGSASVYWRGTTFHGGLALRGTADEKEYALGAELTMSRADSLGGRNLFPGGGTMSLNGEATLPVGETAARVTLSVFYLHPIGDTRNDQPNRLIPSGDFYGVTAMGSAFVGNTLLFPTLSLMRETSDAATGSGLTSQSMTASGWALAPSFAASVPLGGHVDLDPEVAIVVGSVGARYVRTAVVPVGPRRRGRAVSSVSGFDDRISGWWLALGLEVHR
jgi:hypothetical protein